EAWSLIDRGVASPEDVDKVVRYGFGFRYVAAGPVLQKEISGLEVNCAASAIIYPDLCNDSGPPPVLTDKVARGEIGMKTGSGFWTWTPQQAAAEKARYAEDLKATLEILDQRRKPVVDRLRPVSGGATTFPSPGAARHPLPEGEGGQFPSPAGRRARDEGEKG
ncbi:MAG TPA: 3-hydroxyacyl-CoA dehydrogenase family protein, partial [Burkholderiales bacterium]|nr:3-hydroxyacyl-CoA dehydrogenase family protein [Burkholderiales bacterium]